jgi:hypothetical protein
VFDPEAHELARRQHGLFTRVQVLDAGMTQRQVDRRLRTREWVRVGSGVYRLAAWPTTWESVLLAACLVQRGLAGHRAAAALHGIDGYPRGRIEIVVPEGRRRSATGAIVHQTRQFDLAAPVTIDAIPTTGLARTVLDVAAVIGPTRLESTVDAVLRDGRLTLRQLQHVVAQHSARGRDGCGRLREILDRRLGVGEVPLSDWSRRVARLLETSGLPRPALEHRIESPRGDLLGQVDLAYPDRRVAIELDSVRWHLNREAFERDPRRRNRITVAGWTVLNFTWSDFRDHPMALVTTVHTALTRNL